MTAPLTIEKTVLREQIRTRLKGISPAERAAFSRQVCGRLPAQSVWQTARSILFYTPLADEIDVFPLFAAACAAGKKLASPRYISETSGYQPFWIQDPYRDLEPGHFGIREPKPRCQPCLLNQLDLALVPGVGFDRSGHRLGRGQGYYDRLLAHFSGVKCGVGFDCQVVEEIPAEPHDVRLHCILTPSRWHWIAR